MLLNQNLDWLKNSAPALADLCSLYRDQISFTNDKSILFQDKVLLSDYESVLDDYVLQQLLKPSRVACARIRNQDPTTTVTEAINQTYDRHTNFFLESFPCFSLPHLSKSQLSNSSSTQGLSDIPSFRDYLVLGSLCLVPLSKVLAALPSEQLPHSLTLIESDVKQLVALLSILDLERFVQQCKERHIGFNLIYNEEYLHLQEQLYVYLASQMPTSMNGLQVISSPLRDPAITRLRGWIYSKSGLSPRYIATLGTTSDELNQVMEAAWNMISHSKRRMVAPVQSASNKSAVLVASGPSLDDHLEWLKCHHSDLFIVAAGSSIGTLLRAGIHVDLAVQLERGSGVYDDMLELVDEGLPLDQVVLVSSMTSDPRLSLIFKDRIFFHRPIGTATALAPNEQGLYTLPHAGPEAANSALEVLISLGFSKLLLIGCDFAATSRTRMRSLKAAGHSPRQLDIPVRGSHGRTVFTDASLLLVRDVFANTLRLFPHVDCVRLGEGVEIARTHSIDQTHLAVSDFTCENSCITQILVDLPLVHANPSELGHIIMLALKRLDHLESELSSFLSQYNSWTIESHRHFANYFSYGELNASTAPSVLVQRLWRQALFFMLQPLYDASEGPLSWQLAVSNFFESYRYAKSVFEAFLGVLVDACERSAISPVSPVDWNPPRILQMIQQASKAD